VTTTPPVRLTDYTHGGGCACKIPPGELEDAVSGLVGQQGPDILVGLDAGDDAAAVRIAADLAVLSTADFFTPVVDDAYDWGRIAAANALSDVYAMGGRPVVAINLVGWPRDALPMELMTEVLRGGLAVAATAPPAGRAPVGRPRLLDARRRRLLGLRQVRLGGAGFLDGCAAPRAGEGAVEVPSARVAVVHDAGRLSSGTGAFLEVTVNVVWGSTRPRPLPRSETAETVMCPTH
jgi:hypothetical protein